MKVYHLRNGLNLTSTFVQTFSCSTRIYRTFRRSFHNHKASVHLNKFNIQSMCTVHSQPPSDSQSYMRYVDRTVNSVIELAAAAAASGADGWTTRVHAGRSTD